MDIVRRHSFDGTVKLATQAVTEKTAEEIAAQAALNAADTALVGAKAVCDAAKVLAEAGSGDRVANAKAVQEAANQQAAAEAAQIVAQTRQNAATKARTDAEGYLVTVTTEAAKAKATESNAQVAEAAAIKTPADENLKKAAAAARRSADEAADKLAPSASSLLTEARDKVASVQDNVVPPQLKTALLALMDNAGTDLNKAQANLEQWFNDAMDRVSGVYKRKSQVWVLVIAILVTVFANVDSLQIADSLSRDKALRESLVAAAPELAKADKDAVDRERALPQPSPTPPTSPPPVVTPSKPSAGASQVQPAAPTPTPSPSPAQTHSLRNVTASLDEIKKLGVPLGYIRVCTPGEEKRLEDNCPNAIDAAVMDAEASLKKAQDDLDKATTKLQKAAATKTAADAAQKSVEAATLKRDQVAKAGGTAKADAELALVNATAALEKANDEVAKTNGDIKAVEATKNLAAAQVKAAKEAHDQAINAAVAAKQTEADSVTAEVKAQSLRAEAKKHPTAENEKLASDAETAAAIARRKADDQKEMERIECPKCRKESELSASELKQRLPTTHGYHFWSGNFFAALWAILGDSGDLLYSHWLGWLLTSLAISLGAPFWFDMLNRLMVIRSTVKPHEKSKEQDSKDSPDETDGGKDGKGK